MKCTTFFLAALSALKAVNGEESVCPPGYVLGGSNGDAECPGPGHCCGAGWTSDCGKGCAKQKCVDVGGTWIEVNSKLRPYTCQMGKCPSSHPFAYLYGKYCCAKEYEKVYPPQGSQCDGSKIQFDSLCCRNDDHLRCPSDNCTNYAVQVWNVPFKILFPHTVFSGPSINHGTPVKATIAFELPNENAWIVGVNEGGYLKMVKLKVTAPKTFDWIATKYNKDGNYNEACLTTFSESCFVGTDANEDKYRIKLVSPMFSGPSINYGTPVPATIAFELPNSKAWIVGVNDGGYLKMVKFKVTGPNTIDWIATKYNKEGNYNEACLTTFSESCFVGTDANEDKYRIKLVAVPNFRTDFNDVVETVTKLMDEDQFRRNYGFTMMDYIAKGRECADKIMGIADHIEEVHYDTGIARTTGGGVGILGGLMMIGGIIAAPFSGGTSLALAVGGATLSVSSGATTLTAYVVRNKHLNNDINAAKELINGLGKMETIINGEFDKLKQSVSRIRSSYGDTVVHKAIRGGSAIWLAYSGYVLYDTYKTVRGIQIGKNIATFIQSDYKVMQGITIGFGSPGIRIPYFRVLVTAGSTTAKIVSSAFAVVGVGFGVWDVIEGADHIRGSEYADAHRVAATNIRKKMDVINEFVNDMIA